MAEQNIPVQPIDKPILCSPYDEPTDHWIYDKKTGEPMHGGTRRPAGYWYKTDRTGSAQGQLFAEEERDDLPLVNALRDDVRRWRETGYRGASSVTKDLFKHWVREDALRRLFFCQREAVETVIYLAEIRIPGRSSRTLFKDFALSEGNLKKLLEGKKPDFAIKETDFFPTLVDKPFDSTLLPLSRLACKMATGSGKTVCMSMLIAWAFCNRGVNPASKEFPNAVLICCPNLTVKERLQVLRPDNPDNYYDQFEIVPSKYKPLLQSGKVLITNWHAFAPESEHKEGDSTYTVVNKGPETPDAFARRILGDLYDRMPILVLNDEGHHCWRPAPEEESLTKEEKKEIEEEKQEATVWVEGLDRINNSNPGEKKPGISLCVDLSATPFYIKGSGHPEGRPFPWIVSDFGLVDAIESGIVKIPRLPVSDVTGKPEPKYFRLWKNITDNLKAGERLPGKGGRPKPEVVYRESEGALKQIAGQWVERFEYMKQATPDQEYVPPVLILVCDNTDIATYFYEKISGEREEDVITEEEIEEVMSDEEEEEVTPSKKKKSKKKKKTKKTVHQKGEIFPEYFSNSATHKRTLRIDSKLLAEAESEDPKKNKNQAAEDIRKIVSTVGKVGQPGEHIRCVVSVGMLNEGWDANNVTHILGIRAFGSQLLCEQVVGRGLRRMDYVPDPETKRLTEEYVDVYGIPFSVIPFKGRPTKSKAPDDKPKNHIRALEERRHMEIRFPVVEGYAFALKNNLIKCEIGSMEPLRIEPSNEPTATFVKATVGYQEGYPTLTSGLEVIEQTREEYYSKNHLQTILFEISRRIVDQIVKSQAYESDKKKRVLGLCSRHQLFPQVFHFANKYVAKKVDFHGCHECELGLEKYVALLVERLRNAIEPDNTVGEPPLLPVMNRYKPIGTTADVDFKTIRSCRGTRKSHINQVVLDTHSWEATAAFRLEQCKAVECYARNDRLGLEIPYEYYGINQTYIPDFLVRLSSKTTVILEIKGYEDEETRAKHTGARKWVSAVNNWGQLGRWAFHVCKDPQLLVQELEYISKNESPLHT
jgi:type III restriction enzyme